MNFHRITPLAVALALAYGATGVAHAAIVSFNTNPFAGSTALTTPGRQVFAGLQQVLPSFNVDNDVFAFNAGSFGLDSSLTFVNALASALPAGGADVIVLQDSDNDSNPSTPFNAGAAANIIAASINTDGDGFFVYWNSILNVNRLVYSTNLNEPTADLGILARINSPTGSAAITALPSFRAENFAVVPEPGSLALALSGLMGLALVSRRSKKTSA